MLSATIFIPLLGAIAIALLPRDNAGLIRRAAALFSAVSLVVSLLVWARYDAGAVGIQLAERFVWIPTVNIQYFVGVDGLSLPLVVLTTLLTFLAVLASWRIELRVKEYFALLLTLETGVLGVFTALDLFLFFLFWEVELIPMYLLIGIWGGARREYAAIKFVIYTVVGSAFMLLGIFALFFATGGRTFDMVELSA